MLLNVHMCNNPPSFQSPSITRPFHHTPSALHGQHCMVNTISPAPSAPNHPPKTTLPKHTHTQGGGLNLRPVQPLYVYPTIVLFASGAGIAAARAVIESEEDDGGLCFPRREHVVLYYRVCGCLVGMLGNGCWMFEERGCCGYARECMSYTLHIHVCTPAPPHTHITPLTHTHRHPTPVV